MDYHNVSRLIREYRLPYKLFPSRERYMHINSIGLFSPASICRAASAYISDDYPGICMAMLSRCETLSEVLGIATMAYASLSASEQALYAQTLSELRELAALEKALVSTALGNVTP